MKVGKHTLLIDGNYFVFSRLFVLPKPKGDTLLLGDDKQKSQFMRKLSIDFASEMRKLKMFVDDVVLTVDSKSWRKDLYPEAQYKGTRKQNKTVDWTAVYEVYEAFQEIVATKGVTVHQIQGAEADDVIFGWSAALNARGKSTLVWSGDRDLIQLVNYSTTNDAHTLWYYNTKKSLYGYKGFEADMVASSSKSMTEDDMLFNMGGQHMMRDAYQTDILDWITANKIGITEVDCDEFIFQKILTGDKSDNIPSVVTWQKEMKNGKLRNYSITDKTAQSIFDQFVKEYKDFKIDYLFSSEAKDTLTDIIYRVVGHSSQTLIKANLTQNIGLMLLHNNTIPDPISKAIYAAIEKDWEGAIDNKDAIMEMDKILEGTTWLEGAKKNSYAPDPFAGIDFPQEEKAPMKLVGKKTVKAVNKDKKDPTKKLF
jgi:5'-3' exonuclease|tara:strand:+ start:4528 stop:5802 length:1275 start_codon:yes stop_codon:yes gene_type:complete